MTRIYIHGKLGKIFGEYHELDISRKMDVVKAIDANQKGFKKTILSSFKKQIHFDLVDPNDSKEKFDSVNEYLNQPAPEELHIMPSVCGSGFLTPFFIAAAKVGTAVGGFLTGGSFLGNLAMGIIMEGIGALLSPKPKGPASQQIESKVDQSSYLFSSLENQALQGFPIPMLYGELRVGSAVVSVNVLNEDIESG